MKHYIIKFGASEIHISCNELQQIDIDMILVDNGAIIRTPTPIYEIIKGVIDD